jgi:hypothetical protein
MSNSDRGTRKPRAVHFPIVDVAFPRWLLVTSPVASGHDRRTPAPELPGAAEDPEGKVLLDHELAAKDLALALEAQDGVDIPLEHQALGIPAGGEVIAGIEAVHDCPGKREREFTTGDLDGIEAKA